MTHTIERCLKDLLKKKKDHLSLKDINQYTNWVVTHNANDWNIEDIIVMDLVFSEFIADDKYSPNFPSSVLIDYVSDNKRNRSRFSIELKDDKLLVQDIEYIGNDISMDLYTKLVIIIYRIMRAELSINSYKGLCLSYNDPDKKRMSLELTKESSLELETMRELMITEHVYYQRFNDCGLYGVTVDKAGGKYLYMENCQIEDLHIDCSNILCININNCLINKFHISNSQISHMNISNSTCNNFHINDSKMMSMHIEKSNLSDFVIRESLLINNSFLGSRMLSSKVLNSIAYCSNAFQCNLTNSDWSTIEIQANQFRHEVSIVNCDITNFKLPKDLNNIRLFENTVGGIYTDPLRSLLEHKSGSNSIYTLTMDEKYLTHALTYLNNLSEMIGTPEVQKLFTVPEVKKYVDKNLNIT